MEYLKSSIAIKDYLLNEFPLPDIALELIINNLKLAVDIDGYTKEMLQYFINNHFKADYTNVCNLLVENIACRKYNKTYSKLNKYELIGVIQHFNINIPIRPKPINVDITNIKENFKKTIKEIIRENVDQFNTSLISNLFGLIHFPKESILYSLDNFPKRTFIEYTKHKDEFIKYIGFSRHNQILIIYEYDYMKEPEYNQNNFTTYYCINANTELINDMSIVYKYLFLQKLDIYEKYKADKFNELCKKNALIELYDKIKQKCNKNALTIIEVDPSEVEEDTLEVVFEGLDDDIIEEHLDDIVDAAFDLIALIPFRRDNILQFS